MEDNSIIESTLTYQRPLFNITQPEKTLSFEWTIHEDMKLIELCNQYKHQWSKVSTEIKTKDPRQCNYRYKKLKSKYFLRKFNRTDDVTLISLVDKHGNCWEKIENDMPGYDRKSLKERYEQIILPKRLNYSSQEEIRYQTEEIHLDCFDQCEVTELPLPEIIRANSGFDLSSDSPFLTAENLSNNTSQISNQQFVNKTYLSLFGKYQQRLVALSRQITREYRYYSRTINKPEIKKLKLVLDTINSEIKASSSLIRKMKNNSFDGDFLETSLTLMTKNFKAIKISQLLLNFFRKLVREI